MTRLGMLEEATQLLAQSGGIPPEKRLLLMVGEAAEAASGHVRIIPGFEDGNPGSELAYVVLPHDGTIGIEELKDLLRQHCLEVVGDFTN